VEEEASKLNIKLNPIHFEEVATKKSGRPAKAEKKEKTESKPKGRPKKSKKVLELAGEEEDLFASLVMSANGESNGDGLKTPILSDSEEDEEAIEEPIEKPIEEPIKKQNKNKVSDEEKALAKEKKQVLEDEKAAKKKALEDEKAAKKKALEDEKAAKKKALEDEKAAKKKAIEDEKALAKEKKKVSAKDSEEEEPDVVKKIDFEGKKYLKSKNTGIIYNMDQEVIGKWNEEKQRIDFNEVAEELEEEYDDDN
jgi:hypothetical protein